MDLFLGRRAAAAPQELPSYPTNNNGPERHYRADKEYFNFERASILPHIIRIHERVQDKSWNNDIFGCDLHREIWCGVIFHEVQEFFSPTVSPVNIYWKVKYHEEVCGRVQQEDGIVIPSRATILAIMNNAGLQIGGADQRCTSWWFQPSFLLVVARKIITSRGSENT